MTAPPSKPRILIVDDDPMVLATLRLSLEREAVELITAPGPQEALRLVDQHDFAVILSDFRMRHMTGLEFLNECRRRRPNSYRILFTAVANVTTVEEAVGRGEISCLIAKPWKREQFVAAIREGIQRHSAAPAA